MLNDDTTSKRKLLSLICHGTNLFSVTLVSVAIPLVIFFIADDSVVKENAREALNFHLNMWVYGGVVFVLTFLLIGYLLAPILGIVALVFPILAILQTVKDPDSVFRYPFIFRLL
jgi:uncharacterized Tic20 family protein